MCLDLPFANDGTVFFNFSSLSLSVLSANTVEMSFSTAKETIPGNN